MNATLSLHDSSMTAEDIAELTGRLRHDIEQETELTARQVETAGGLGAKGDFVSIGQIALVALGSGGTVVTLLQVLKSYVERKPMLRIELEVPDGRKLKLEAEHLRPEQIEQTLQAVKQLWPESDSPSS
ncbi:hypothetical protein GCAAIG_12090 [Candidatus Electronema halotolerans]